MTTIFLPLLGIPLCGASLQSVTTIIDLEVQRLLNEAHAIAHALLSQHYDQLTGLADALLEYEQLDHEQFEALLNTHVISNLPLC